MADEDDVWIVGDESFGGERQDFDSADVIADGFHADMVDPLLGDEMTQGHVVRVAADANSRRLRPK
jgi:hypothetical protein